MTVARDNRHGEREAITAYRVVHQGFWHGQKVAVAEVRLHTGRTHQIRVHMSYAGYPLLGEKIYNRGRAPVVPRQMLHSWKLEFTHPVTGDRMSLEAEIPEDIKTVIREITKEKQ